LGLFISNPGIDSSGYHLIPVNAPRFAPEKSYQRDGFMRVDRNGAAGPTYWPNSSGGPEPDPSAAEPDFEVEGFAGRHAFNPQHILNEHAQLVF
jgi:catalase